MNEISPKFNYYLEQPQMYNFEININKVRIIKGDHRNYIPQSENDPVLKKLPREGSVKKKTGNKVVGRKSKRRRKKSKRKRSRRKSGKRRSRKSSKGSRRGSKKGSRSPKGSKKGSRKGSKKGSKKGGKKKSKDKKKKSKTKSKSKDKKDKKKGAVKPDKPVKKEELPGNRKQIPPIRLIINALGFKEMNVNQIDVDPDDYDETIFTDGETPNALGYTTTDSSEHGPVDPEKLKEALEDVKQGKKKRSKKSKSRSRSSKGSKSGKLRKSKSGSKRGSKSGSRKGSKKGSKLGSKKGSKSGSRKGSRKGSKKGSPKKGGSSKNSPKGKKSPKSGKSKSSSKSTPKKKAEPPPAIDEDADTWSVVSETTIKRGIAIMFAETPKKMIAYFQGSPVHMSVERYGGKWHENGKSDKVGNVSIPFPPEWSEAILQVQRITDPSTYDEHIRIARGLEARFPIKDPSGEDIGDVSLEMNLSCYATTAVSKEFPSELSLYRALAVSTNIPKCCDAIDNKTKKGGKSFNYYDVHPRAMKMNYTQMFGL